MVKKFKKKKNLLLGIDGSDLELVIKSKLQKDSTILTGETFSEVLSPRSSKSSKVTTGVKKSSTIPLKGRQTPEWFTRKIKTFDRDSPENGDENVF